MLTIRLARTGRKKLAHYRVVAADSRRAATGKFVAQLGHYNPHSKELVIDEEQTQKYIDSGAQPSSRMVRLLKDYKGIKLPEWTEKNLVVKEERKQEEPEAPAEESKADAADATSEKTDEADEEQAENSSDDAEKDAKEAAEPKEAEDK